MAIMIPSNPDFIEKSHEDLIFDSLKNLPDDCFVLHSLRIFDPDDKEHDKKETEIDFVVLIPGRGCVVIEAKYGDVKLSDKPTTYNGEVVPPYTWLYASGQPMKGGGPFSQSRINMYTLKNYLSKTSYSSIANQEVYYSCVWFHGVTKGAVYNLPDRPECPKQLILSKEDLQTPSESILKIMEYSEQAINMQGKEPWNYEKISAVVSNILAPTMSLVPGKNWEYEYRTDKLNKLLHEQERILEFLSEQKVAVISGAAGTGKTMIALKKAQIEADEGKRVLFLCYNKALYEFLDSNYKRKNITYYDMDKFACSMCKSNTADYGALENKLDDKLNSGEFPYDVILIDEAQDFGQKVAENAQISVLNKLYESMVLLDGLLYLFYDKNQIVNCSKMPEFITNADCKMTLYRNCRNTKSIADASLKLLKQKTKLGPDAVIGNIPNLVYLGADDKYSVLFKQINALKKSGYSPVVLTVKGENSTAYYEKVSNHKIKLYGQTVPFYTCRQYKGLEADAVVLVDVDANTFKDPANHLLYYVGTSRAKFELVVIADMVDSDCEDVCKLILGDTFIEGYDYKEQLALALAIQKGTIQ